MTRLYAFLDMAKLTPSMLTINMPYTIIIFLLLGEQ